MTTLQTLLNQMQAKQYLEVTATISEQEWIDTAERTFVVVATRTSNGVTVTVNGQLQQDDLAAHWVRKVVDARVKFQPVQTEAIDLAATPLDRGQAAQLHTIVGVITKGIKLGISQYELASRALDRHIGSYTEITLGEVLEVTKFAKQAVQEWHRTGGYPFLAVVA